MISLPGYGSNGPTRRSSGRAVTVPLQIAGVFVDVTLEIEVEHYPGQHYLTCRSFYDAPADPPSTEIRGIRIVAASAYDDDGNAAASFPVITGPQLIEAARDHVEEAVRQFTETF